MITKNIFSVAVLLFTCNNAFAQTKEYNFKPEWKVGDKKSVRIVQHETEYKKGKLVGDDTTYLSAEMAVLSEDDKNYTLKVLYENVALTAAINFYDKMGEELSDYKNLELKYTVDKQGGKAELINWKEAQQFMNTSFDRINEVMEKKAPDAASYTKLMFAPLREIFNSKQNIESYMSDQVGYLLFPYGKKFVVGDTLTVTSKGANPFNPMDSISQTTVSYLDNIDDTKKVCDINYREIFDLSKFKEMMKTMMEKMMKSADAGDKSKTKTAKEIDSIDFDVTNKTVITFDYNSTWPLKVVKIGKVVAGDPSGKTEKTVFVTATIK
ncbi:MAG: hypothetical protein V4685_02975 [Bacteroidota bacterium]